MIVYFSVSSHAINENAVNYKKILQAIRAAGHTIGNDWVEVELLHNSQGRDMEEIVKSAGIAIQDSEVFIAEVSGESTFGVGYEVSLALQLKKPTLLLTNEGAHPLSYAEGIVNEVATHFTYNNDNVGQIVTAFLKENDIKTKDLRFNFVIDRKIHNHLRLKSFKTGKTKAEVVRDLLIADIEKET